MAILGISILQNYFNTLNSVSKISYEQILTIARNILCPL